MRSLLRCVILAACLLLSFHGVSAQQVVPQHENDTAHGYADEAAVVERDEVLYRYNADGTGTRVETTAVRVQSAAALQSFAVVSFPYASVTQDMQIVYARVRKPDGTVVETPTTDAQDQPAPVTQLAPMYSDLHVKQLPLRSLAVGDVVELQTRATQKQADIPGEFWGAESFGAGLVFLDRRIELRVPKGKAVTVYSPKNPPEIVESGEERVYRWKGAQLRRSNAQETEQAPQDKTPPIAWTTFPSWEAVGAWYQGLMAGRDAVTPALQAKADELTAGAKTDTEKVRALYEYVSQHNHYVGVNFGVGRYQPHTAAEVLANQYGDCKDKHTLLAALLRAKGFEPSAALIGAGIEMNEKVPSPAAFNHLITVLNVDGAPVWLDATTEVAPYRVLLPILRDKQALVVPARGGAGSPHLARTPAELPFAGVDRYEGKFELAKDGTTKGSATVTMRGDNEVEMRYASRQVARAQWDQLGQAYVDNTGFYGKASSVVIDGNDELAKPWEMRYEYTQEAWSEWKSYRIGSLLPNVSLPGIDEKKPPEQEIDLGGRHTQTARSTVHLPAGYSVELPDSVHLKTEFATFDETYRLEGGSLVSEFTLEVLKGKVDAADWRSVKKLKDDIGVQPWIQVVATERNAGGAGPPVAGESNAVAAELVRQVHDAILAKDYDLARKKSDQALAINDKQAYLWSQRGFIAWQQHHLSEAASDYERELRQHPESVDQYRSLIQLEHLLGHSAEERTYLLAYAKAAPNNEQALLFVGNQLLAQNHVDDAVDVYRAGVSALPESRMLQVELGSALVRAGKKDEAASILKKALGGASDADVLNDGAYALLGDGDSASLPLAEMSAKKAVEMLEAESVGVALESVNKEALRRVNLLLASWDTLGWVYFAEGKYELAEEHVRASWRSAAHAEVGLHMGQILEKKGDATGAMRVYEMALSRAGSGSATPVTAELHMRIDGLRKKGVAVQDAHPKQTLQQQRTFHVSRPSGVKGSAVFAVQVSATGTEKVAMVAGEKEVLGLSADLGKLDFGLAVPRQSHASLLRTGVLTCATEPTCEFVLTPPELTVVK